MKESLPAALLRFGIYWGLVALAVLAVALVMVLGRHFRPGPVDMLFIGIAIGFAVAVLGRTR